MLQTIYSFQHQYTKKPVYLTRKPTSRLINNFEASSELLN